MEGYKYLLAGWVGSVHAHGTGQGGNKIIVTG